MERQDRVCERRVLTPGRPWLKGFIKTLGRRKGNQHLSMTILNWGDLVGQLQLLFIMLIQSHILKPFQHAQKEWSGSENHVLPCTLGERQLLEREGPVRTSARHSKRTPPVQVSSSILGLMPLGPPHTQCWDALKGPVIDPAHTGMEQGQLQTSTFSRPLAHTSLGSVLWVFLVPGNIPDPTPGLLLSPAPLVNKLV